MSFAFHISLPVLCLTLLLTPYTARAAETIDFPPAVPTADVAAEPLEPTPAPKKEEVEHNTQLPQPSSEGSTTSTPQPESSATQQNPAQEPEQKADLLPILDQVEALDNGLILLELFSSQACTFCPPADTQMAMFLNRKNLISLSCHIDYFDVKTGSLALPFCSTRQSIYESSLRAGPKYTPQMVVNGAYNAVGYRQTDIKAALENGLNAPLPALDIAPMDEPNLFELTLPAAEKTDAKIWLMVFDKPRMQVIAEGAHKGKTMTYYNIVSNAGLLGAWDGSAKSLRFDAKLKETSRGFAVIVQDSATGRTLHAGQYLVEDDTKPHASKN